MSAGGGRSVAALGPSPRPLSPWQMAQLVAYRACPDAIDADVGATGLVVPPPHPTLTTIAPLTTKRVPPMPSVMIPCRHERNPRSEATSTTPAPRIATISATIKARVSCGWGCEADPGLWAL